MIDRRMLMTLLASAAVAPPLSPRPSWGQAANDVDVGGKNQFWSGVVALA
jgi:hypothetical protein